MVVSELEVLEVVVSLELGAARAARRVRAAAGSGVEVSELLSGGGRALALAFRSGRVLAACFALGLALAVLCFARALALGTARAGTLPSELSVSCSEPHPVGGGLRSLFRDGGIESWYEMAGRQKP